MTALERVAGAAVTLVAAQDAPRGRAELFADATDDSSVVMEWTMPRGRFVDAMPLLIVTTASLRGSGRLLRDGDWNVRRFRPKLSVDTEPEGGWRTAGAARRFASRRRRAAPSTAVCRCTMITRAQPGLERDLDIYKTVARYHDGNLACGRGRRRWVVRVGGDRRCRALSYRPTARSSSALFIFERPLMFFALASLYSWSRGAAA